jgi:putative membrane protein
MKRTFIYYAAWLAMILAVPISTYAAGEKASAKMPASDAKFMKKVAQDGKAEVELGRLAAERGTSDAVKQFGQRMVTDHGKAGDELAKLAQDKGVELPADMDAKHKRLHDRLAKLSGAEFDREYMKEMVRDHDTDVKAFQREADRAKDADLKAWAAKTLPTLKEHQQQAHQMQASVSGKNRSEGAASPKMK